MTELGVLRATVCRRWAEASPSERCGDKVAGSGRRELGFKPQLWVTLSKLVTLSELFSHLQKGDYHASYRKVIKIK